jgi:hypothetical protein
MVERSGYGIWKMAEYSGYGNEGGKHNGYGM